MRGLLLDILGFLSLERNQDWVWGGAEGTYDIPCCVHIDWPRLAPSFAQFFVHCVDEKLETICPMTEAGAKRLLL